MPNRIGVKLVTTFRYPIRVEVRRPKFKRSASLEVLDIPKLTRAARAEFEVGHFEAGRCRTMVRAVVRKGIVTALRVEPCAQCKSIRLTPELQSMLKVAQQRIGPLGDGPWRPMPVVQFMSMAHVMIVVKCYEFCVVIWGHRVCVFCCKFGLWGCTIYSRPEAQESLA